jgi:predicted NBD/HSP70 family sugar kinase
VSQAALAIDLGGTKASFAIIDSAGAIRSRAKRPSHEGGTALSFDALVAGSPAVPGRVRASAARALAGRGPVCPSELMAVAAYS